MAINLDSAIMCQMKMKTILIMLTNGKLASDDDDTRFVEAECTRHLELKFCSSDRGNICWNRGNGVPVCILIWRTQWRKAFDIWERKRQGYFMLQPKPILAERRHFNGEGDPHSRPMKKGRCIIEIRNLKPISLKFLHIDSKRQNKPICQ
jgi:hypothetical protein